MKQSHILIFGAGGRLGAALARAYAASGQQVTALRREDGDLRSPALVAESVRKHRPDIVINSAAMTNVDACEGEEELARTVNALAPGAMAEAATATGARLLHISTDYVFSGEAKAAYAEDDPPEPISAYGETKREGEQAVLAAGERHAVIRVSWVFGPDRDSFIDHALRKALRGETVEAVDDKWSSPTYTRDVAAALPVLMEDEAPGGVYHVCNRGVCTWRDWAQEAIHAAADLGLEVKTPKVGALRLADIKAMIGRRPVFSPMTCAKIEALSGQPMRPWQEAVADYVRLLRDEGRLAID